MLIDGGCHCGAVSYQADVDPKSVVICHCTDCQTFSGAPYRTSVAVQLSKLQIDGEPKVYVKAGGSGRPVAVSFCGECGTALYSHGKGRGFVFLRVGSCRQRAQLAPTRQGFCKSAMPWAMDIRELQEI